jgi:hypothetical protein
LSLLLVINAGQYMFGLGLGSVDSAFEYGFPFSYYEYVPMLSRGRVLYLGLVGNTLAAIGIAIVSKVLLSRLTRRRGGDEPDG